jgi:hypothetical protein
VEPGIHRPQPPKARGGAVTVGCGAAEPVNGSVQVHVAVAVNDHVNVYEANLAR